MCRKCEAFGVLCNYDGKNSDLELSNGGAVNLMQFEKTRADSLSQIVPSTRKHNEVYGLQDQEFQLLSNFRNRTAFTIGVGNVLQVYQTEMVRLAASVSSHKQCPMYSHTDF